MWSLTGKFETCLAIQQWRVTNIKDKSVPFKLEDVAALNTRFVGMNLAEQDGAITKLLFLDLLSHVAYEHVCRLLPGMQQVVQSDSRLQGVVCQCPAALFGQTLDYRKLYFKLRNLFLQCKPTGGERSNLWFTSIFPCPNNPPYF